MEYGLQTIFVNIKCPNLGNYAVPCVRARPYS